jgi:hypothetical protein
VRDWAPDFLQKIREGRYRKRSISIYNDLRGRGLYLRHVGFTPIPEVKGLADLSFFDQQSKVVSFEFGNQSIKTEGVNMSEVTAERLLERCLGVEFSESALASKVSQTREQMKRDFVPGPVTPVSGLEECTAAEILSKEKQISFGEALAQVKFYSREQ